MTAEIDGEVTIFTIGMCINRFWRLGQRWPVVAAMPRVIRQLLAAPEPRLPGRRAVVRPDHDHGAVVAFVRASRGPRARLPAWAEFNRRVRASQAVSIWREAGRARPGEFECICTNMPAFGLAG